MDPAEERALAWLYRFADMERGVGWNPRASVESQWQLGRTRALLDLAGAPDKGLRVVLVAGTKGKGSTCAMLASLLDEAGLQVGLYTKPHLQSYRERIRLGGEAIAPEAFQAAVERMGAHVERLARQSPEAGEPTTFEVTTALAVEYFAREQCDVAVMEVGLGGRLDATNALEPELSLITPISYDHTAILGRTLGAIAREKAGILRARKPALLAQQRLSAARPLRSACYAIRARCRFVPPLEHDVPLAGEHQRQNAALAIEAARALTTVTDDQVSSALERVRWPGRFEVLDGDPPVVLDGAHNGASAEALARTLGAFAERRPIQLIVGINRDKDARAVLEPLLVLAHTVWATQAVDSPRALHAYDLARLCRRLGPRARPRPKLSEALDAAQPVAREQGGIVCVTGSLALVGHARTHLGLSVAERLWR